MAPTDANLTLSTLSAASTIVFVQKFLKTTQIYARFVHEFPAADKWAHRFVAGVGALIAAAGIHIVWNWHAASGGQVIFTLPDVGTMLHGLSDWFQIYILQHFAYEATSREAYVPPPRTGA